MGNSSTKLERALAECPDDERYFGLENFGNTCYCNSVLQALYFCRPFRERVLACAAAGGGGGSGGAPRDGAADESLLTCLVELFQQIHGAKKKTGVIPPKRFVQRLKRDNEQFCSYMHQDAHEFLNYLLNTLAEVLEAQQKQQQQQQQQQKLSGGGGGGGGAAGGGAGSGGGGAAARLSAALHGGKQANGALPPPPPAAQQQQQQQQQVANGVDSSQQQQQQQQQPPPPAPATWVHDIFQGWLVSETRCLQCETVTRRDEQFMDLSLEIDRNASLTACLKAFSQTELLARANKFECERCGSHQEAQRAIRVRAAPPVLILHLKRFKFIESLRRERKLMHRVVFPFELKLPNTTDDAAGRDALYGLFAVVVHVGSGPHHGHYVSLIKSRGQWLFFDDDSVDVISEATVAATFGATQEHAAHMDHGYILFYERGGGVAGGGGGGGGGSGTEAAEGGGGTQQPQPHR